MYLKRLSLKNYRNISSLDMEFSKGLNLILGENAQGKTNIIEAIYMAVIGRAYRAAKAKEAVKFGEKDAALELAVINERGYSDSISIRMDADGKRAFFINNIKLSGYSELFGNLLAVIFWPDDIDIVRGSPKERRRFMDIMLTQTQPGYYKDLIGFNRALKQRNALLKAIGANRAAKEELLPWDEQLCFFGMRLISARAKLIDRISPLACGIYKDMTGDGGFEMKYDPMVPVMETKSYLNMVSMNSERDIMLGSTLWGPHRDELAFSLHKREFKTYGSQGQQRAAAIAVKLSQLRVMREFTGSVPVLLLDDIFSELDEQKQKSLLSSLEGTQVILTSTSAPEGFENAKRFRVKDGKVEEG